MDRDSFAANTDNIAVVDPGRRLVTAVPRDLWDPAGHRRINRAWADGGFPALQAALAGAGFPVDAGLCLRRSAVESAHAERLPVTEGELRIDPERMEVTVAGEPAELTPLEFRLLWTLAEGRDRALSRDEIFRRVWGGERAHGDRSVDVLVRRLRRKVDEVPGRFTYVRTLHGVGYRFLTTPRRMPGSDAPIAS